MAVTIERWGRTLALRIPAPVARAVRLKDGSAVTLSVRDGTLVVVPTGHRVCNLDDLLKQVSKKNLHGSIKTGPALGEEAW